MKIPNELRPFTCHGVQFVGTSGDNEFYGSCTFCGDQKHFYVNGETGQFNCKKCSEEGNTFTFLDKIAALHALEVDVTTKKLPGKKPLVWRDHHTPPMPDDQCL